LAQFVLPYPNYQLWRSLWYWRQKKQKNKPLKLQEQLQEIDITTDTYVGAKGAARSEVSLAECSDCQYWPLDNKGEYLKTGTFRAHIRLCPR
jgi:hypothetical protein